MMKVKKKINIRLQDYQDSNLRYKIKENVEFFIDIYPHPQGLKTSIRIDISARLEVDIFISYFGNEESIISIDWLIEILDRVKVNLYVISIGEINSLSHHEQIKMHENSLFYGLLNVHNCQTFYLSQILSHEDWHEEFYQEDMKKSYFRYDYICLLNKEQKTVIDFESRVLKPREISLTFNGCLLDKSTAHVRFRHAVGHQFNALEEQFNRLKSLSHISLNQIIRCLKQTSETGFLALPSFELNLRPRIALHEVKVVDLDPKQIIYLHTRGMDQARASSVLFLAFLFKDIKVENFQSLPLYAKIMLTDKLDKALQE